MKNIKQIVYIYYILVCLYTYDDVFDDDLSKMLHCSF